MYVLKRSGKFKKNFKKICRRKEFKEKVFLSIVQYLQKGHTLPTQYENHKLQDEFTGCMECHIQFDLLLIYMIDKKEKVVYFLRIGSHSDLF